MPNPPQAFLSYTTVDDQFFGGAITSLRKLLELGVRVVTGDQSFKIFQDIDGVGIGQHWPTELAEAIQQVRFLIPILTPCFLRSEECRDELTKFIEKERTTGRNDLILPVYFVTTPLLEKPELLKADELALEISTRQRYDWRSRAELPITDTRVLHAVKELAEKISEAIARTELEEFGHHNLEANRRDREFKTASERIFTEETTPHVGIKQRLVLWVDDRPENNIFERKAMQEYGVEFVLARSTADAFDAIERLYRSSASYFNAIISDMGRPPDPRVGHTLLESLRARGNQTPYFLYARSREPTHIAEALPRGAQGMTNVPGELIEMVLASVKGMVSTFTSFNVAIPSIESALDNYIRRTPNPQIYVLGFVLYYQWPMLDSYLSRILSGPEPRPLTIHIALLDPDWTDTAGLNEDFPGSARNNISLIKGFSSRHREQIHQCGWSIDIFTFRYTPHWFGILIGDDVLFLGRGFWKNGILRGGSNRVERITAQGSIMESEKIDEFRWLFQQCRQKQIDIGLDAEAKR